MRAALYARVSTTIDEPRIREKVKQEVTAARLLDAEQVRERAKRLASDPASRQTSAPPDLKVVIVGWTHSVDDWTQRLREVLPYMDYVDEVPSIGQNFRAKLRALDEITRKLA